MGTEAEDWWSAKFAEIRSLFPTFGGVLVKADCEGNQGPQSFNKTEVWWMLAAVVVVVVLLLVGCGGGGGGGAAAADVALLYVGRRGQYARPRAAQGNRCIGVLARVYLRRQHFECERGEGEAGV